MDNAKHIDNSMSIIMAAPAQLSGKGSTKKNVIKLLCYFKHILLNVGCL